MIPSYPHYTIDVEDRSIFTPSVVELLPVHRAHYAMICQKGPVGVPVWYPTWTDAVDTLGAETFNELNKKYFSNASAFLNNTMISNGAFITRIADPSAEASKLIVEASVKTVQVTQYQKDGLGNRIVDEDGQYVPEVDGSDVAITETGVEIAWSTRSSLMTTPEETAGALVPRTVTEGADTVVYYPIFEIEASSVGAWGNDAGIKFFWDNEANTADVVDNIGAAIMSLGAVVKEYEASTTDPVRDKDRNTYNSFIIKPDVIDTTTNAPVSMKEVLENAFDEGYSLPFTIKTYSDHWETLCETIRAVETNRSIELVDAWYVNPVSLKDIDNKPYDHAVFKAGSKLMSEDVVHYLAGGTDGAIDDESVEGYVRNFYELDTNPDIVDKARYPFTHVFDIGYSLETKETLVDFMSTRDDVKIVLSTQRSMEVGSKATLNTLAVDRSIGTALRSRALLHRESVLKGTESFRVDIFSQAGILHGNYKKIVPASLWYAIKLAEGQNREYMGQDPQGLPHSEIDIFKTVGYVPSAEDTKRRSWDVGMNYFQYGEHNVLIYASLRSVYRYDTSVLSSSSFTNAVVYCKHLIRSSWTRFTGVEREFSDLSFDITNDLNARLETLLRGRYAPTVEVYRTTDEANYGYVSHVAINLTAPGTNRVWKVDIITNRDGFTA